MEYTKGDWEVNKVKTFEGKEIYAIHAYPEPCRIQRVADVFTEANAHLIAAAPKLYNWIKELGLHMAVNYDDDNEPYFIIDKEYLAEAHTILALADKK